MVIFNNDPKGKSVVNALQMQNLYDPNRKLAPLPLVHQYRQALAGYQVLPARFPSAQQDLFQAA
jgi:hypothetical protein